ncbi:MAG: bifunctional (p)ppGpp synthetase/guanosine-3',5'-bis(diphosphate) 3'-pyrophosphohydrolase [Erysipelotrichaceae bacterium]|nr:bifunctional (p)ppGpp synthetase/guanosine-3',5'-bis(diphosphate) 3'-pyrophosphohydrolase [Erysipelotrichaceae bacterium]
MKKKISSPLQKGDLDIASINTEQLLEDYAPQPEVPVLHTYEELAELFNAYIKDADDRKQIYEAFKFAEAAHEGQFRKSGEPFIHHLVEVAYILAQLQAGPATIIAGLLHDSVEDTPVEIDDIKKRFGEDVAMLVDSLTKIQAMKLSKRGEGRDDFLYEDYRKIFLGMAKDIRVIIIKLADRLHNLRTLGHLSKERQLRMANETLSVYVPIAHRLGMNAVKAEMEDICLKYTKPRVYHEIDELVRKSTRNIKRSLLDLKKKIADILFEHNIPFRLESRIKSIYSIYRKMEVSAHKFEEIYDIMALRVITETELNCYEVLGLIHATYKPMPGRFKDYIAMPKSNMYQSLHTTIIAGDGQIYEIQIRTEEMDEVAEGGVAAHWRYEEGTNYDPRREQKEIEEQLHWFRDFIGVSKDMSDDAREYMDTLQEEIFDANVYVFTPKGKVIELPNGSTPIDFAYRIHTAVGDSMIGATVNNNQVPLNTVLKTGDIVEIKTSKKQKGPNEDWINIAFTRSTKAHIRKYWTKKNSELMREDRITKGKTSLVDAFRDRGINEEEMLKMINDKKVFQHYNVDNLDEFYLAVCSRNPSASQVIDYFNIERPVNIEKMLKKSKISTNPVLVKGAGQVATTLGKCCSPIPSDNIVGYVTKGKGVTVHRDGCPNITQAPERIISVMWNNQLAEQDYPVDIVILADDRDNLLVDIMNLFSSNKIGVNKISAHLHPGGRKTSIKATILVKHTKQLKSIFAILNNIAAVEKVERIIH